MFERKQIQDGDHLGSCARLGCDKSY